MPPLGGMINLREDTSVDLQLAQQIGGVIGTGLGMHAAEKRKQRLDAMMVGVLTRAAKENWTGAQTLEELKKNPELLRRQETQWLYEMSLKQQFDQKYGEPYEMALPGGGSAMVQRGQTGKIEPVGGATLYRPSKPYIRSVMVDGAPTDVDYSDPNNPVILGPTAYKPVSPEQQDLIKGRTEGQHAQTELTKARTENIQQDTFLDQLNYDLKEEEAKDKAERNQALIDNYKSQIKYREEMVNIRGKSKPFNYDKEYKSAYQAYIAATGKDVFGNPETDSTKWTDPEGVEIAKERLKKIRDRQKIGPETAPSLPDISQKITQNEIKVVDPTGATVFVPLNEWTQQKDQAIKEGWKLPETNIEPQNFKADLGGANLPGNIEPPTGQNQKDIKGGFTQESIKKQNKLYEQMASKYGLTVSAIMPIPGVEGIIDVEGIPYFKLVYGTVREEDFRLAAQLKQKDAAQEITDPLNKRKSWQPIRQR